MRASLARWGNSLAIRVPKEVTDNLGLREGATLDLTFDSESIVLRRRRYAIRELVDAMDEEDQHPLLLEDEPKGTEEW